MSCMYSNLQKSEVFAKIARLNKTQKIHILRPIAAFFTVFCMHFRTFKLQLPPQQLILSFGTNNRSRYFIRALPPTSQKKLIQCLFVNKAQGQFQLTVSKSFLIFCKMLHKMSRQLILVKRSFVIYTKNDMAVLVMSFHNE